MMLTERGLGWIGGPENLLLTPDRHVRPFVSSFWTRALPTMTIGARFLLLEPDNFCGPAGCDYSRVLLYPSPARSSDC